MKKKCDKCMKKNKCCCCVKKYTTNIFKELSTIEDQIQTLSNQQTEFANTTLNLLSDIQTSINNIQCSNQIPQTTAFPGLSPYMTNNIVASSIIQSGSTSSIISNPINVSAGDSVYVSVGYFNNVNSIVNPIFTVIDNLGNTYIQTPPSISNISEINATIASQFFYIDNIAANNNLTITLTSNIILSSIILGVIAVKDTLVPSIQNTIDSNGKGGNVSIIDNQTSNLALVNIIGFGTLSPLLPLATVNVINTSNPISGLIAFTNTPNDSQITLAASNGFTNLSYWTASTINIKLYNTLIKPYTLTQTYVPSQTTPINVSIPNGTIQAFITATGGGGAQNSINFGVSQGAGGGAGTISAYQLQNLNQIITINQIGVGGINNTSSLNGTNTSITVDGMTMIAFGGQGAVKTGTSLSGGNGGDVQIGPFITFGGLGGPSRFHGYNGNPGPNAFGGGGGGSLSYGGNSGSKEGDHPYNGIYACSGGGATALANGNSGNNGSGASTVCSGQLVNGGNGVVIIMFTILPPN